MKHHGSAVSAAGIRETRRRSDTTRAVGPHRPARAGLALAIAALAAVAALAGVPLPASAEESGTVSAAFAITSYADGQFVSGNRLAIEGTASGGTVTVSAPGAEACSAPVVDGVWRCPMSVSNGAVVLTATRTPDPSSLDAAPSPDPPSPDAAPSPDPPSPDAAPESIRITLNVLGAPTIAPDDTIGTVLSGGGYPGATVVVAVTSGAAAPVETRCATVATDGTWACTLDLPSGDYLVSARQHVPGRPEQSSPPTPAVALRVDRDPPPAPLIGSPTTGARVTADLDVSGSGDEATTVSVFVDGGLACSAPVQDGRWSCAVRLTGGAAKIVAVARDGVGNYSAPSAEVAVTVPGPPSAEPAPTPEPTRAPDAAPDQPAPPDSPRQGGTPSAPLPPSADGWSAPTGFGARLPAVATAFRDGGVLVGLAAGAAFVALVGVPLRLARGALGTRIRAPRIFGRNRRSGIDPEGGVSARSLVAVGVGWAVVVVAAAAVRGSPEYVRLVAAVLVSLAVLNVVGGAVAGGIAARLAGVRRTVRAVPALLAVGAAGVLLSSIARLEPPIVIGVVLVSAVVGSAASAAVVQLVQLGAVELLAVAAWVALGSVGARGLWGVGLREVLAGVAISGLTSVVVLLLPIGALPGRAVFEWSRAVWAAAAVLASGTAALVLGRGGSAVVAVAGAVAVGAACLAVWAWIRFVEPALAERG